MSGPKMRVRRLKVRNFLGHRAEDIEFPDTGIILLWGPSGAGKSSLLEAIPFAWFGHSGTRMKSLGELRHELYPDEDFSVEATFAIADQEITVFRGVVDGRTLVWLRDLDGTMVEGPRPVSDRIKEIMGQMDGATFFATYFSQQGELANLIAMQGAARRRFVQRMAGVLVLDPVSKKINEQRNAVELQRAHLEGSLPDRTVDELAADAQAAAQDLDAAQRAHESATQELAATRSAHEGLQERLQAQRADIERLRTLGPQITALADVQLPGLQARLTDARAQADEAQSAQTRTEAAAAQRARFDALQQEERTLGSAANAAALLESLEQEAAAAHAAHDRLVAQLAALPELTAEDPAALIRVRDELAGRYVALGEQIADVTHTTSHILDAGACTTCLRELPAGEDRDAALSGLQQRVAALEAERAEVIVQGKAARDAAAAAQQAHRDAHARAVERSGVQTQIQEAQRVAGERDRALQQARQSSANHDVERLAQVRKELGESAETIAGLAADARLAQTLPARRTAVSDLETQHENARRQWEQLSAERASISIDEAASAELERAAQQAAETWSSARERAVAAEAALTAARRQRTESDGLLTRARQVAEDLDRVKAKHATLNRLGESIKAYKNYLITSMQPRLQSLTSQHLHALTDGATPGVQISDDYELAVARNGDFRRINSASGGEQARAAFALRLALTQLVSERTDTPVGFLVFDEIFGSQDADHRVAILQALRYLRGVYPQTFLISHEESLHDSEMVDMVLEIPDSASEHRITSVMQ